ncbi:MAG: hypothetical protein PWP46_683 [Fusobacteriaceae bacterium]|jgi:NADH:ubiquinone oxidoreductase subunit E|nr:hypothetical protein [Fusobacteriales bacterium]MDN5303804.1 hypothetical protein [Fusobacteriaceae bacterium]
MDIFVCMGTSCYIKGSPDIVEILKRKLDNYNGIENIKIHLKGSFCLGPCIEGIVVKVGDKIFKNINKDNIYEKIKYEIIPYIEEDKWRLK